MDISKTVYFPEREGWRDWLSKNYDKEKEIWLVFPKKASGKPRILYNDAVEEALCFGWIDSAAKRIDDKSYAQRFSPETPKAPILKPISSGYANSSGKEKLFRQ